MISGVNITRILVYLNTHKCYVCVCICAYIHKALSRRHKNWHLWEVKHILLKCALHQSATSQLYNWYKNKHYCSVPHTIRSLELMAKHLFQCSNQIIQFNVIYSDTSHTYFHSTNFQLGRIFTTIYERNHLKDETRRFIRTWIEILKE